MRNKREIHVFLTGQGPRPVIAFCRTKPDARSRHLEPKLSRLETVALIADRLVREGRFVSRIWRDGWSVFEK